MVMKKIKLNGMWVVDDGLRVVVNNAYEGYANFSSGVIVTEELRKECEELLGFPIHDNFDSLLRSW